MSDQDGTTTTETSANAGASADAATAQQATAAAAAATQAAIELGDAGKAAIDRMKAERDSERVARATALTELETEKVNAQQAITERDAQLAERDSRITELQVKADLADRFEIALDNGLPKALAVRLQGSTVEELKADAEALKALLGSSITSAELKPDPSQGPRGGGSGDASQQFAAALSPLFS